MSSWNQVDLQWAMFKAGADTVGGGITFAPPYEFLGGVAPPDISE